MNLAIDPGTRALGFALWNPDEPRIVACGVSRSESSDATEHGETLLRAAMYHPISRADVESMRWRPRDARSQPNDLIDVQTTGILAAHYAGARAIIMREPQEWKRNLPKAIHHARIFAALRVDLGEPAIVERACDGAGTNAKEVLDAVGIALYVAGRIDESGKRRDGR
jgi:hypothetical protein